jgi:tRNA(fMet)-specific endonuclease VapC
LNRICLDTSAYSHFRRGEARAVQVIDSAEWVGVPSIVLGELWAGFLLGTRTERNVEELQAFLRHPAVEPIAVDDEVARIYGEIIVDLRGGGTPIPTNDVWIAACAARSGAAVLTFDAHFRNIARVGSAVLE